MDLKETVEGMLSRNYKEKFVSEYAQMFIRYYRLNRLISRYENGTLEYTPKCPISILAVQNSILISYLNALEMRAEAEGIDLTEIKRKLEDNDG